MTEDIRPTHKILVGIIIVVVSLIFQSGIIQSHQTLTNLRTKSLDDNTYQHVELRQPISDIYFENETYSLSDLHSSFGEFFNASSIETSVNQIIPYKQTISPLHITATGPSDIDNVTLYYRNSIDNKTWNPSDYGITWCLADNHRDGDAYFHYMDYPNKAIVRNAYPLSGSMGMKPSNTILAYVAVLKDSRLTIINTTKQWNQIELSSIFIPGGPHDIYLYDYPDIGRVAFIPTYNDGKLYTINVKNVSDLHVMDVIDNTAGNGMYVDMDETNKILYMTEYNKYGTDYVHAYNVTDPNDIRFICSLALTYDNPWQPRVNINDPNYIWVSAQGVTAPYNGSVSIINVTWVRNNTSPSMVFIKRQGYGSYGDVQVKGTYLYGVSAYTYHHPPQNWSLHIWDISDPLNLTNVSITEIHGYTHFSLWTSENGHEYMTCMNRIFDYDDDYGVLILDVQNKSKPFIVNYIPNIDGVQDLFRCHWQQIHHNNITNADVLYVVGYIDDSWVTFNLTFNTTMMKYASISNPDTAYPWSWEFNFPNGTGYYEFYSIGKKAGYYDENAPPVKDALCCYIHQSSPPFEPHNPTPGDGATLVNVGTSLIWIGGDPDIGDTVTYDVYFGTTTPPPNLIKNQSSNTYQPPLLDDNTTYFWKIVSWDTFGASTEGPVWSFKTAPPKMFIPSVLFGRITNKYSYSNLIEFDAINTWKISFSPLRLSKYSPYERVTIENVYIGFVGKHFILTLCKSFSE